MLHRYEETNQQLYRDILEKSRNFYLLHFLFIDAAFGMQPKSKKKQIRLLSRGSLR